jgi:hypothetical protein
MRHLRVTVMYLSMKSAIPTIHSRSKKSSVSRLGFRNIRLGAEGGDSQAAHSEPGPQQLFLLTWEPCSYYYSYYSKSANVWFTPAV